MKRHHVWVVTVLLVFTLVLPIRATTHTQEVAAQDDMPVTADLAFEDYRLNVDPQTTYPLEREIPQNLFLGLVDIDPITKTIVPQLATDWEVSDDGLVWTFHLRSDVFWIASSPENGELEPVRPVDANDVVSTFHCICDARVTNGQYANYEPIALIRGCNKVYTLPDASSLDMTSYAENIGVMALNSTTVQIEITEPASHFLTILTGTFLRPLPIEFASNHTVPISWNVYMSGPYVLVEDARPDQLVFERNAH
jgi:oligopeptide transport system substrate-binding protein